MDILNIGIIASVDSGKTTLTEKILEVSENKKFAGNIKLGNTTTDYHNIEKNRGITIFSEEVNFKYKDTHFNLIDTPGHIDFFEETRKSTLALDAIIFVISALDGVTSNTLKIWKFLQTLNIPVLIFLNKCDSKGVDTSKVL